MKLNYECVRDTLLAMESMEYNEALRLPELMEKPQLTKYTENEVQYTCLKLLEAGYIVAIAVEIGHTEAIVQVSDITFRGHEFLNTVREDKNWKRIVSVAKSAGVFGLKEIAGIGAKVTADAITQALNSL